ncbi:MAG: hypothetical protein ACMUJM_10540 [bacterium]
MTGGRGPIVRFLSVLSLFTLAALLFMLLKVTYLPKKYSREGLPPLTLEDTIEQEKEENKKEIEPLKLPDLMKEESFAMVRLEETKLKLEHFHNLDDTIDVDNSMPNICMVCHGSLPHSKKKETRSLYNMHTYFCACEVCHLRADDLIFTWFDMKNTKETIPSIRKRVEEHLPGGTYNGNYNAKIVPCIAKKNELIRLDQPITREYAREYIQAISQYNFDQQTKAKSQVHRQLSKTPVVCADCHQKEKPYLDFRRLGYPQHICDELVGTEVAGMIEKYKSLKLPTMFRPEEIVKEKQQRSLILNAR